MLVEPLNLALHAFTGIFMLFLLVLYTYVAVACGKQQDCDSMRCMVWAVVIGVVLALVIAGAVFYMQQQK